MRVPCPMASPRRPVSPKPGLPAAANPAERQEQHTGSQEDHGAGFRRGSESPGRQSTGGDEALIAVDGWAARILNVVVGRRSPNQDGTHECAADCEDGGVGLRLPTTTLSIR